MEDMLDVRKAVPLIFDTDMGNDIDDALALAMIHALQSRGECELLGVTVSKDNRYGAAYVDAVNTFYGRGHIPVGRVRGGVTPEDLKFARQVVEMTDDCGRALFPRTVSDPDLYVDAVDELRCRLAAAEDGSVVVVMVGFSTNFARLFDRGPDEYSDLDGRELFGKKVRHVVMMAGEFSPEFLADPSRKEPEYNIRMDIPSARRFVADCPRPIWFSGIELGYRILYPAAAIAADFSWCVHHPVAEAYTLFRDMPYDRPTWDLTAVLFAVRQAWNYFGVSEPGTVSIDEDGVVRFRTGEGGLHRYLTADEGQVIRIQEAQRVLVSQPTVR